MSGEGGGGGGGWWLDLGYSSGQRRAPMRLQQTE